MKIKITEIQLAKLKEKLTENVNVIDNFEQFCKAKAQEVNRLYSKTIALSVDEIVKGEINIADIIEYVWNMENVIIRNKYKEAYAFIETLSNDDEFENLDLKLDTAKSYVVNKIDTLNGILKSLNSLQESIKDGKINIEKSFGDVKPIDINI